MAPHLFEVVVPFLAFNARAENEAKIDSFSFRLHYRFTSAFLFLSTALLALNNFFGDEIKCFAEEKAASKAVNQFCFITGTFTVPGREDDRLLEGEEVTVHNYYQWVAYILVVQGVLFLLPHQLWSAMEDGRVGRMIKEIQAPGRMVKELQAAGKVEDAAKAASEVVKEENEVIKNIASFIHSQGKAGSNGKTKSGPILRRYVLSFLLCHFLTIANVLLNITLVDAFFGGRFASFGMRWMTAEDGWNALPDVFPRRAGCIWREHGTGGDVQNISYLCYLATNVATEKVFVFMWFWFLTLVPTSLGTFLYYSALLLTRDEAWRTYCLRITEPRDTCELGPCWVEAVRETSSGQFLLLHLLAGNLDPDTMLRLLQEVGEARGSPPSYPAAQRALDSAEELPNYQQASCQHSVASNAGPSADY